MTLIYQRIGSGGVRKCDARCHNAKSPRCTCICGGHYHGKREGSPELADAVEQHGEAMLLHFRQLRVDVSGLEAALVKHTAGLSLFDPLPPD